MSFNLKSLIKDPNEIPSLPVIFYKIMDAIDAPNTTLDEIARLVEKDAGLETRILGLVNSSFYGFSDKITSISHAIGIIGTSNLKELVLSTLVVSRFKNIPEHYVTMESFWSHSIACGLAGKELSKIFSIDNAEGIYVVGMIHDIGSLMIYKEAPEKAALVLERCNEWGKTLTDAEQSVLGFDHTQVGEALFREWRLPEIFSEITAFHHNPLKAPGFPKETAIIYVADYIAQSSQLGTSGELQSQPLDSEVKNYLGLSIENISTVSKKTIHSFEEITRIFLN